MILRSKAESGVNVSEKKLIRRLKGYLVRRLSGSV